MENIKEKIKELFESYGLKESKSKSAYGEERVQTYGDFFEKEIETREEKTKWVGALSSIVYPVHFKIENAEKFIQKTGLGLGIEEVEEVKSYVKLWLMKNGEIIGAVYDSEAEDFFKSIMVEIYVKEYEKKAREEYEIKPIKEIIKRGVDEGKAIQKTRMDAKKLINKISVLPMRNLYKDIANTYANEMESMTKELRKITNTNEKKKVGTNLETELNLVNEKIGIQKKMNEVDIMQTYVNIDLVKECKDMLTWRMLQNNGRITNIKKFEKEVLNGRETRFPVGAEEFLYIQHSYKDEETVWALGWDASVHLVDSEVGDQIVQSLEPSYSLIKMFNPVEAKKKANKIIYQKVEEYNAIGLEGVRKKYTVAIVNVCENWVEKIKKATS